MRIIVPDQNSRPDGRPLPSTAAIARALAAWRPPMPFTVVIAYQPGTHRSPDHLWVTPYMLDAGGETVSYLAAGPAGKAVNQSMIAALGWSDVAEDVTVHVAMGADQIGRQVFTAPLHTAN
jgi:hypothetical protein